MVDIVSTVETAMLITEFIVFIFGLLSGILIELIKRISDKRAFRKSMKNDIKLIIDDLKDKEHEIKTMLNLQADATLTDILQGTTAAQMLDTGIKISDDFYKEHYLEILEYSDYETLIKFYKRIQRLNHFADSSKEYRGNIPLARILNTRYWTNLFDALREGENISI